jgi:hypothetical protein
MVETGWDEFLDALDRDDGEAEEAEDEVLTHDVGLTIPRIRVPRLPARPRARQTDRDMTRLGPSARPPSLRPAPRPAPRQVPARKFCRNCGKQLKPGKKFCTACGAQI